MASTGQSLLAKARSGFHEKLRDRALVIDHGKASNADASSVLSVQIANSIALAIGAKDGHKLPGQTAGAEFEMACLGFLRETFLRFGHLCSGTWSVDKSGPNGIAAFEQYAHLSAVEAAISDQRDLRVALGGDYIIKPDIVVSRSRVSDAMVNERDYVVDQDVGVGSSIRESPGALPLLHASVSCKWTMRSDRAQNTRSEALNLIRNRKGRLPHVVVVTAEPLPSRIASIALGTGDIDCVYHFALGELRAAMRQIQSSDADLVELLVEGKRLKDISDLPLDLIL